MVYTDVLDDPHTYAASAQGFGVLGIIALGKLQLPEIGDSGSQEIQSGTVVYFKESDTVVYRSCKGRGIWFYVSI